MGKVGYLAIQESLVKQGCSQRRAGLHIETPGNFNIDGSFREQRYYWGCSGGIIHIDRSTVRGGIYMASNVDESLPLQRDTYRQFFRLVTSSLSAWYPENATPNPLGIEPDPNVTKVVTGNK